MEFVPTILGLGAGTLFAAMSPGPDFLVVMKNTLMHSRRVGMWTAFGVGSAVFVHVAYSLVGIGLIISQSILLFSLIKIVGALYLCYLGIQLVVAKGGTKITPVDSVAADKSTFAAFREGFFTNVLNPKVTLFFLSIFSQFISPAISLSIQFALGAEVALVALVWFLMLSRLLSNERIRSGFERVQGRVMNLMGFAFVALGIHLAFSRN